jgi:hypothetical protein
MKSHKVLPIYTMTNDDKDIIGHQVHDVAEEVVEETSQKQDELFQKMQDQLMTIQKLLETIKIAPNRGLCEGPSMSLIEEAWTTTSLLLDLVSRRRVLKITSDEIEFQKK